MRTHRFEQASVWLFNYTPGCVHVFSISVYKVVTSGTHRTKKNYAKEHTHLDDISTELYPADTAEWRKTGPNIDEEAL